MNSIDNLDNSGVKLFSSIKDDSLLNPIKEKHSFGSFEFNNSKEIDTLIKKCISLEIIKQQGLSYSTSEKNSTITNKSNTSENQSNDRRLQSFNDKTDTFLTLLKEVEFEDGYENLAVTFFKSMLKENYAVAMIWINNLYISNANNDDIIEKILRVLSFIKYDESTMATFPTIATAAINTGTDNVKEAAIMAFESWRTKSCLNILKRIKVEKEWLNSYLQQVIKELETEIE